MENDTAVIKESGMSLLIFKLNYQGRVLNDTE